MSVMAAVVPTRAHAAVFSSPAQRPHRAVRVARPTVCKAVADPSATAKANKAEWNKLGQVCAVLGSQWGDEGKGKLVDILAQVRPIPNRKDALTRRVARFPSPRPARPPRGEAPRSESPERDAQAARSITQSELAEFHVDALSEQIATLVGIAVPTMMRDRRDLI